LARAAAGYSGGFSPGLTLWPVSGTSAGYGRALGVGLADAALVLVAALVDGGEDAGVTVDAFGPASPVQPLTSTAPATANPANHARLPIPAMMPDWILNLATGRQPVDNPG
jgi:hypothetical protein